ncbi:MAG TPA: hypothetical protein VIK99_02670 [Thermaerobacter sp.]
MRWWGWAVAGLVAAVPAGLAAYFRLQGDADLRFDPGRLEILEASRLPEGLRLRYRLPVVNHGRQKGMLYEILTRPEYVDRWMKHLRFSVSVFWPGVQETGYWAATLVKPGQVLPLEFELLVSGPQDVLDRLLAGRALALVTRHGVIGRSPLRWYLTEVRIPLEAVRDRVGRATGDAGGRAGTGDAPGDDPGLPAPVEPAGSTPSTSAPAPAGDGTRRPRRRASPPRLLIASVSGDRAGGNDLEV